MLQLLFWLFIVIISVQFVYYVLVFGKFSFAKQAASQIKSIPISVIVCAKNEQENIKKYIPLLANQNYATFEIVLIDDASSDETFEIFEEFEKQYSNIKLVKVANNEAFWGSKKYALTLGIKAAKYEYLLFTDANCYPTSNNWIAEMSTCFSPEKTIVLGYSGFKKIPNSFLNKLIRFESVLTATQYFSWAQIGKPYMGLGANLAYKKSEFFKTNGFINHMKIRSGDDDLFINEAANQYNTKICFSKKSFTLSHPKTTLSSWINSKRERTATVKQYKFFDKLQLAVFYFSQVLFIVLAIILLSWQFKWQIVAGLLFFRYLFSWISLGYSAAKLDEKRLMFWYPIIEIPLIFIQFNIFVRNTFTKTTQWK